MAETLSITSALLVIHREIHKSYLLGILLQLCTIPRSIFLLNPGLRRW